MAIKKKTVLELGQILKDEFKLDLCPKDLERLAYILVGYFSLLIKIENRHKFGNHPDQVIDQSNDIYLDKKDR